MVRADVHGFYRGDVAMRANQKLASGPTDSLLAAMPFGCNGADRRYSARWSCDKSLHWRVRAGRRPRRGHVIERSLNGMVLDTDRDGEPIRVGARLHPHNPAVAVRHGFRTAIVRRVQAQDTGGYRLFLEILA